VLLSGRSSKPQTLDESFKFQLSAPQEALAPFEKEASVSYGSMGIPARDDRSVEPRARQSRPGRPCHGWES